MHDVEGYFRRRDGHPLIIRNITSPHDPEVAHEPFDPDVYPPVSSEIRPLLRRCRLCRQIRARFVQNVTAHLQRHPQILTLMPATLEDMHRRHNVEDQMLMERALGHDVRRVKERLEARVIERTPVGGNPSNDNEDQHEEES